MEWLRQSKLFEKLSAAELASIANVLEARTYSAGSLIFSGGDVGDGLYVVKEGVVEISELVGEDNHVLCRLDAGEVFGEMAVLDDTLRSASARAVCPVVVYFISREALFGLLQSIPCLSLSLAREIGRHLRIFNQKYLEEVVQAERFSLVGRVAGSIIHDLKNPLTTIGLAAELADMEGVRPEVRHEACASISRQSARIMNMINELLDFSRGSRTSLLLSPRDFGAFVAEVLEEIGPQAEDRGVSIETENEPPSVSINIDPTRLARVFFNLINNSLDAMPHGGRIVLRFRLAGTEVITEVEDTGPGIAPEIAERLFEAFATYGKSNGTGLGLSICRRIVEDHGGKIACVREPDRGAIFVITLPR